MLVLALFSLLTVAIAGSSDFARHTLRGRAGRTTFKLDLEMPRAVRDVKNLIINATITNTAEPGQVFVNPHSTIFDLFQTDSLIIRKKGQGRSRHSSVPSWVLSVWATSTSRLTRIFHQGGIWSSFRDTPGWKDAYGREPFYGDLEERGASHIRSVLKRCLTDRCLQRSRICGRGPSSIFPGASSCWMPIKATARGSRSRNDMISGPSAPGRTRWDFVNVRSRWGAGSTTLPDH